MGKQLIAKFKKLNAERSVFLSLWQEIADYIIPRKSQILVDRTPGSRGGVVLYDSTAIHANVMLASSLQGAFSTGWFGLDWTEDEINELAEPREWLDDCVRRMYIAFAASNFQTESHELFLDLTSIGTGCMLIEENPLQRKGFNGLRHRTFAIDEYVIDEDENGTVDTLIRSITHTAAEAVRIFGEAAGRQALMDVKNAPDTEIKYLHGVIPTNKLEALGYQLDPRLKNFPFISVVCTEGDGEIIEMSGYHEFPYVVPRWMKYSKEKYGRAPGGDALPDVKTLNKIKMLALKALSKDIDPPLAAPTGVGKLKLVPGALNIMRADLIDKIKPLLSNSRYDAKELAVNDLKQSIKEIFFTDQLQIQKKAQMTATESNITFELMQRLLGPVFGRLGNELYDPATRRAFGIMFRANAFKPIPESVASESIQVKYSGPIAKAQRQEELQAINTWLQTITSIAGIKPDVVDAVDFDEVAIMSGRTLGVGEKFINDTDKIAELRKARQEAEQAAQQQEQMIESAKAMPGLADAMGKMRAGGMA